MWSGQEDMSPLGLAILHRAQNLLVPIHQFITFFVYLCWKSFYMYIAWSNYGLDVLNIAQTTQFQIFSISPSVYQKL